MTTTTATTTTATTKRTAAARRRRRRTTTATTAATAAAAAAASSINNTNKNNSTSKNFNSNNTNKSNSKQQEQQLQQQQPDIDVVGFNFRPRTAPLETGQGLVLNVQRHCVSTCGTAGDYIGVSRFTPETFGENSSMDNQVVHGAVFCQLVAQGFFCIPDGGCIQRHWSRRCYVCSGRFAVLMTFPSPSRCWQSLLSGDARH